MAFIVEDLNYRETHIEADELCIEDGSLIALRGGKCIATWAPGVWITAKPKKD